MPMERGAHEKILGELLNPELPHADRTELLQELRADYHNVLNDYSGLEESNRKLNQDKDDLLLANSKLFRETSPYETPEVQEEVKKEFSETVTLSELEKTANQ